MNRLRQRKLIARENRQASLHNQGMTVEKTSVKLPQPKALEKKETVKVKKEKSIPVVAEVVKRGPGRPPKTTTDKNMERRESKNALSLRSKGKKK